MHWKAMEVEALILLQLAMVISDTTAQEKVRYQKELGCEGVEVELSCTPGHAIHVVRANFGRFAIEVCNSQGSPHYDTNCAAKASLRVIHNRCSKQRSCFVWANSTVFGDPCPGTSKYLEVHYQCLPALLVLEGASSSTAGPAVSSPDARREDGDASSGFSTTVFLPDSPAKEEASRNTATSAISIATKEISIADVVPTTARIFEDDRAGTAGTEESPPSPSSTGDKCPSTVSRGLTWAETETGKEAKQRCPPSVMGRATWRCTGTAWKAPGPDLSRCKSLWVSGLQTRVRR